MTTDCLIALGGNVGDVAATIAGAISQLTVHPQIDEVRGSRLYATAPVGAHAAEPFLNAAVTLQTSLSPHELLEVLQSLEAEAGRVRTIHWGPRPLDLDLILYGEQIVATETLTVPHPACWYRRFVLDPSAEIAADMIHPVLGVTIGALRQRLLERPLSVALVGEDASLTAKLISELSEQFAAAHLFRGDAAGSVTTKPALPTEPALTVCLDSPTCQQEAVLTGRRRIIGSSQSSESPRRAIVDILTSALDEPQRHPG